MQAIRGLVVGLAAVAMAVGCGEDAKPSAKVMAVHASPDAPSVDLIVDGAKAGSNLAFPGNSGYLQVPTGTRNITVNPAGSATPVLSLSQAVAANKQYTIFVVGQAGTTPATLGAEVFEDNLTTPAAGKAHVRFFHGSPNAPAVDVAVKNGPVLISNVAFKQGTDFAAVDAGTYSFEVRPAGTSTVALEVPNVALAAGKIYTVFAKGLLGGTGAQALGAGLIVNN